MNLTTRKSYWFNIIVGFSILINSICGGKPLETVCTRAWRQRDVGGLMGFWAKTTIKMMDKLEPGHCRKSYEFYTASRKSIAMTRTWVNYRSGK